MIDRVNHTATQLFVLTCWMGLMGGCTLVRIPSLPALGSPGAKLQLTNSGDRDASLSGKFATAIYRYDSDNNLTLLLLAGPVERPTQAVTIRMFWQPRAAFTPIDKMATNATISYMVFAGENQGEGAFRLYSGAGFLYLKSKPGRSKVAAGLWQATLQLSDTSGSIGDDIQQMQLTGSLIATRDDLAVNQLLHQLRARVSGQLGYPRFVMAE